MSSVTPPAHEPSEKSAPLCWPELADQWMRVAAIRWSPFAAFVGTLTALVLVVAIGGPLALACIFGPLAGGSGYALGAASTSVTDKERRESSPHQNLPLRRLKTSDSVDLSSANFGSDSPTCRGSWLRLFRSAAGEMPATRS
jgi:hypothetical protein